MGSVHSKSISDRIYGLVGSFLEHDRVIFHVSPGDLVEVHRGRYRHWIMVESIDPSGTVWCFHVTGAGHPYADIEHDMDDDTSLATIRKEVTFNGKARLKYEPLDDILKDTDQPKPSLCRVNNQSAMATKMCTTINIQAPDVTQILKRLHQWKDTLLKYDLKDMNCEHYCTFWKYGIGWSSQVNSYKQIITAGLRLVATSAMTAAEWFRGQGCYRIGMVCLLVSTVSAVAAQVIDGIEITLRDLHIEQLVKHAIAN